jgi:RNA polymerase sigma factor (sigma-70 family)
MRKEMTSPFLRFLRRLGPTEEGGETNDRQLLQRFASCCDEAAFAALVRRHGPMVLAVCRRVLHEPHDAEDAFQAVFLVLVRKAGAVREPNSLGNWLYGVAYRTAQKARCAAARRRAVERQATSAAAYVSTDESEHGELRCVLDDELSRLPAKYRAPVVLCYLQGHTQDEAARQLGCPRKTVTTRLTRACDRLRARLTRRGLTPSAGALTVLLAQGKESAAVPACLAGGTVQAASSLALADSVLAGAVPERISLLARGVLRSMYFAKLRMTAGVCLLAVALFAAAGFLVRGATAPPAASVQEKKRDPGRDPSAQEKKELAAFHRLYALPPGVHVKRFAPPYAPEREAFYRRINGDLKGHPVPGAMYLRSNGTRVLDEISATNGPGSSLHHLPYVLQFGIFPQQVEGPRDLLDAQIDGDFIVRVGVPANKVVSALEIILRQECHVAAKLSLREVERKVIVVTGNYKASPLQGRPANLVEIYGAMLVEDGGGGGGSGDFATFLRWVGMYINRQVVNEAAETPKGTLRWHYNERPKFTDEERGADHDEKLVLKHLVEQTGLSFSEATRRVPVLFVERAD